MTPGRVFSDDKALLRCLTAGQGIVIIRSSSSITIWGTPKDMATECCDLAKEKVGALVGRDPANVSILVKGGINCTMSPNSVICRECPGL